MAEDDSEVVSEGQIAIASSAIDTWASHGCGGLCHLENDEPDNVKPEMWSLQSYLTWMEKSEIKQMLETKDDFMYSLKIVTGICQCISHASLKVFSDIKQERR